MKNYERIYPISEKEKLDFPEDYEGYIFYAEEQYKQWTGTYKREKIVIESEEEKEIFVPRTLSQRFRDIRSIYSNSLIKPAHYRPSKSSKKHGRKKNNRQKKKKIKINNITIQGKRIVKEDNEKKFGSTLN